MGIVVLFRPCAPDDATDESNVLGRVPHQIRGVIGQFSTSIFTGYAYDKCTACSEVVLEEYQKRGKDFLLQAISDPKHLEVITGLKELHETSVDIDVEWDE